MNTENKLKKMSITNLTNELICVEVEREARSFRIYPDEICYTSDDDDSIGILLPEGNYEILGEASSNKYGFHYEGKIFNKFGELPKFLESKGCILTDSNKFIIIRKL